MARVLFYKEFFCCFSSGSRNTAGKQTEILVASLF